MFLVDNRGIKIQKTEIGRRDTGNLSVEGGNVMAQISIIVPVYNVEAYISRCIDSILAQTFVDFELILVDDGSTDRSGEICDSYAGMDSRIRVIHKENGGASDARNTGIDTAEGRYIGFVDSDDYIAKDMYEKLLKACVNHKADLSVCGRYDVKGDEAVAAFSFDGYGIWSGKEAVRNLLTWNNIDSSACDKLFDRSCFAKIRFPYGRCNEDIFVVPKILINAEKIVHIGESKYYYFHRTDSRSAEHFHEKRMDLLAVSEEITEYVTEKYPDLKHEAESFYYKGIIYLLSILQFKEDKRKYRESYRKLKMLLLRNFFSVFLNRNIEPRRKIIAVLLLINAYPAVRKFVS